jgi:hypothetical protein
MRSQYFIGVALDHHELQGRVAGQGGKRDLNT